MIYIDSHGGRVETHDPEASRVVFWPQGGGWQASADYEKFHELFTPAPAPTWRAGTVTAYWLEGKSYPCWSDGDVWNGSGMPFMTAETVNRVLADLAAAGVSNIVKWVGDQLIYDDLDDDPVELVPITVDGCAEPLYPLGGFWTWNIVEFGEDQ